MTDQWIPGPPKPPPQWVVNPLPPSNEWNNTEGCDAVPGPAIVQGITITGVPATITAPGAWRITLNSPPDFTIDRLDSSGNPIDSPLDLSAVDGSAYFPNPVYLSADPVAPLEAATKQYVDDNAAGIPDAPDNQTYGRTDGAWNLVVPAAGGTFTGVTNFSAGGAVTSGAMLFVGSAVCSIPTIAQLSLGGGSLGQVPATDGNGNLSWVTPVTGGPYLPLTGGTITGSLTVNTVLTVQGSNSFVLNGPNGNQRAILGQTSTLTRWQLMLGDGTSEGLNNTGSNFSLTAYATAGGFLGNWLTIARADGSTVFNGSGVTIQGGLAVNGLLALADLTHLAIYGGSAGQVLTTNGSGLLSWTTPAGGGGGISDAPNDGTAYARKSLGWAHLTHTDITDWTATLAGYLPLTGGSLSGNLTIASTAANGGLTIAPTTGSATLILDRPSAAMNSIIDFQSAGVARWRLYSPTNEAETGGNAGSNFQLWRFSDTGVSLGQVLGINRATGAATFSGGLSAAGITAPQVIGDNRIINGDMRIDQRGVASSGGGTVAGYTVDRWQFGSPSAGHGTWSRAVLSTAAYGVTGFPFALWFASSGAYTLAAGEYVVFQQQLEADATSDFMWGTAGAQPATLSFWAVATVTGTYTGAVRSGTATRSYPFNFSLVAGTWTKVVINIPPDTTGSWQTNGNTVGLLLTFSMGSGATFAGPPNAWSNNNYLAATGGVSVVATNAAAFGVTGVKLEVGSVATPFNQQSLAKSMQDCRRYYQVGQLFLNTSGQAAAATLTFSHSAPVVMRAAPTLAAQNNVSVNFTLATLASNNLCIYATGASVTAGAVTINIIYNANAEL
jgi:hypothetical protein